MSAGPPDPRMRLLNWPAVPIMVLSLCGGACGTAACDGALSRKATMGTTYKVEANLSCGASGFAWFDQRYWALEGHPKVASASAAPGCGSRMTPGRMKLARASHQ